MAAVEALNLSGVPGMQCTTVSVVADNAARFHDVMLDDPRSGLTANTATLVRCMRYIVRRVRLTSIATAHLPVEVHRMTLRMGLTASAFSRMPVETQRTTLHDALVNGSDEERSGYFPKDFVWALVVLVPTLFGGAPDDPVVTGLRREIARQAAQAGDTNALRQLKRGPHSPPGYAWPDLTREDVRWFDREIFRRALDHEGVTTALYLWETYKLTIEEPVAMPQKPVRSFTPAGAGVR